VYKSCVSLVIICCGGFFFSAGAFAQELPATSDVRDPTTPLGHSASFSTGENELALELNSVLISQQRRLAIINGNSLREGQPVPGTNEIIIQRILPQKVLLKQGDRVWAISLSPDIRH
jgi:MSHA biogenesis protein MshK